MFTRECDYYGKDFIEMHNAFKAFCRECKKSMSDGKCHRGADEDSYFKTLCFAEWGLSEHTEGTAPKVMRRENEKGYQPNRFEYGIKRGETYLDIPPVDDNANLCRWVPIELKRSEIWLDAVNGEAIIVGVPNKLVRELDCEYYHTGCTVKEYLMKYCPGLVFCRGVENLPDAVIKWFGGVNENDLVMAKVNQETGEVEKACRTLFCFEQEEYEKHYEEAVKNKTKPKIVYSGEGVATPENDFADGKEA